MSPRTRWLLVGAATVVLLGAAVVYGVSAFARFQERQQAPSTVASTTFDRVEAGDLVFRNTAAGAGYGLVATVPADDPGAGRAISETPCDRVDATTELISCLRTDRGIVTTFESVEYDPTLAELRHAPLPGIPSRTRVSPDSQYVATTAFVTGHSYATIGFSTATVVTGADGTDYGNLEDFAFTVNDAPLTAVDRNFWGVTFVPGTDTFYATGASGGRTWLLRGDLGDRTLTAIRDDVECPSLSPDGTRIAFKKNLATTAEPYWTIAVVDLASGAETVLPEERNVDDQVEWLDDGTLLYGMPRTDTPGDSDVWAIPADGSSPPELFLEHAWSPSVVR